ncbi:MAG: response regulator [Nitrospinaceae bacterium]
MKKHSVLLIDDEETLLATLSLDLIEEGYDVTTARTGAESVELLKKTDFDVVITDLLLEGLEGLDILREVKKTNPESMVLILTGYGSLSTAIEALREGASDYLLKPCNRTELALRVRNCIDKLEMTRKIKLYENILPVCCVCNKIRMGPMNGVYKEKWVDFETYLKNTTGLDMSHGYCPVCLDSVKEEVKKAGTERRREKEEVKNGQCH